MKCAMAPFLVVLVSLLFAFPLQAQVSTDPTYVGTGGFGLGFGMTFSDIEYEVDSVDFDIDRTVIGIEGGTAMGDGIGAFGYAGFILDGEIESSFDIEDGSGFILGAGGRGRIHQDGKFSTYWAATFQYIGEEYEEDNVTIDIATTEIAGGAFGRLALTPTVNLYGGLWIVPYSDGEIEVDPGGADDDIEREDIMNLIVGAKFRLTSVVLRPEIRLIGQQTFGFSVMLPNF